MKICEKIASFVLAMIVCFFSSGFGFAAEEEFSVEEVAISAQHTDHGKHLPHGALQHPP